MGVGEVDGPPKKKLKQAQLPFCISPAERSSNKRKLSSESPETGFALKVCRKDSTPRALAFYKENVKVNNVAKITDIVDLSSDTEEDDLRPTNVTAIKECVIKCVDEEATRNEKLGCDELVKDQDVEPNSKDDVTSAAKSDDVTSSAKSDDGTPADKSDDVKSAAKSADVTPAAKSADVTSAAKSADVTSAAKSDDVTIAAKSDDVTSAAKSDDVTSAAKSDDVTSAAKSNDVTSAAKSDDVTSAAKSDVSIGPKEMGGKKDKERQVEKKIQEHKAGESQDHKVDPEGEIVNDSQAEESVKSVSNRNVASTTEGSQSINVGEHESKKTSDLSNYCGNARDSSLVEPKLDQSIESDQGDPNSSIALSSEDEQYVSASKNAITTTPSSKKVSQSIKIGTVTTPKLSKADRAKLREEKIRLKEELRRQKKEDRERKKQEELKMKEEERKKKEDEKKRKEEEKKKKEEAREEEKRKKEEDKKKKEESKEEDRKKREEAKLAEERKEKLAKMAFTKFFIPNKTRPSAPKNEEVSKPTEHAETLKFMPFPVKVDMRLAAQVRNSISDEAKKFLSDGLVSSCAPEKLYLDEIREGLRKPYTSSATWPLSEEAHDVVIVESVVEEKSDHEGEAVLCMKAKHQRAKLLQFHDNRRPPYWGTWRKKSSAVTPRRPFGQDTVFDYEVDSDSEWEDEEEGEDIDKEGESDKEQSDDENVGEDGYLLDNTFVPHGYLSDEEAAEEEENLNPEDQKLKLKVLKQEFEQELKAKTRLKPRLLGCVCISNETTEVSKGSLYETLMNFRCRWDESEGPINPTGPAIVDCTPPPSLINVKFPLTLMEQLVRLVHGSRLSHINLVTEFMNSLKEQNEKEKRLATISKRAVSLKIKEIAHKTPSATGKAVWTVSPELCKEYDLPDLEPPSISSPANPVLETPPKPKETALVNFLKKASTSTEPRRRVTPTLLSPVVDLTETKELPEFAKTGICAPPPAISKPGNTPLAGATKTGIATTIPPVAPPVRKRIQPITLSRTLNPSTATPTTPKMEPLFRNPMKDTPRPPPARPPSPLVIDICNDSN